MAKAKTETTTVSTLTGDDIEVPVGIDGVNPVSPNNPAAKAVAPADREAFAAARKSEIEFAEALASAAGLPKEAASTNKEDNQPLADGTGSEGQTSSSAPAPKK